MPQRLVGTDSASIIFYMLGVAAAWFELTGGQVLGAVAGAAVLVTAVQGSPTRKLADFLISFLCGLAGSHLLANIIEGFTPDTVSADEALGTAAAICAVSGLIILRRIRWAAENPKEAAALFVSIRKKIGKKLIGDKSD